MVAPIGSLFISSWGSNPGFAISFCEKILCRAGIELAAGDESRVHFAFTSLERGRPRNLPYGIRIVPWPFARTRDGEARLLDYVEKNHIELVQLLDFAAIDPLIAKLRRAGARTILSYWGAPISGSQPRWKYQLRRLQFALSRSRVDGLVFESQAMARLAVEHRGIAPRFVDVAPALGVNLEALRPRVSDYVYRRFGFPRDLKIVVFAGHVIRRKGIHVLIEAAVDLLERRGRRDVAFLVCGNRDGDSDEFAPLYAGRGLDSVIRFGGYRDDIKEIFCSSFCGVLPTTGWESLTLTALEMAACGLPIVASRLQGLTEAVVDGTTGILFTPGCASELADALEMLLNDSARAAELGRSARSRSEREFSLERQYARYIAVLQRRLAQTQSRSIGASHRGDRNAGSGYSNTATFGPHQSPASASYTP